MLRSTAKTGTTECLHFRFSRRTLSFGPEEFCIVSGLYMGRCPRSMIEFSTMYKHGYEEEKKNVVASDIVYAENHIPEPPIAKPSFPVRLLKPSQYVSSPYVSVQNAPRYCIGGVIRNEPPPPVSVSDPPTLLLESYVMPGCNVPSLYMGNKSVVLMKHRFYNEKMEAKL
ncbi:unnamed protein product [Lactuca saligna]|uniref:Uncharacterized protein n=1 Tax=Lactuca saligna TaxID=75948 RepID=A0AA35VG06_LACSI|nr:unnamed protein product [Lactuca saligna]